MQANSQRPGTSRKAYIALLIALPIIASIGFATYKWLASTGQFEPWKSLGSPPEPATRIIGICYKRVCVETADHTQYFECSSIYEDEDCWKRIDLKVDQIVPLSSERYNSCPFEFNIPKPPADTIQLESETSCDSYGGNQTHYALQNDGTVWMWSFNISGLAPFAILEGILYGFIFGVAAEIILVPIAFEIQHFRSRDSTIT